MNKTQKRMREHILKETAAKMAVLVRDRERSATIPLPEIPDNLYKPSWWRLFSIDVGFSPENVHTIFMLMKECEWECTDKVNEVIAKLKSGDHYQALTHWYHKDIDVKGYFAINFTIGSEGSNCTRVKIGTKTVEEDVFEVVCDEGIEEAAVA